MLREGSAAGAGPGKGYVHPSNYLDENACHACGGTRLTFEPAAIYCSICVQKIKRNQASTPVQSPSLLDNHNRKISCQPRLQHSTPLPQLNSLQAEGLCLVEPQYACMSAAFVTAGCRCVCQVAVAALCMHPLLGLCGVLLLAVCIYLECL